MKSSLLIVLIYFLFFSVKITAKNIVPRNYIIVVALKSEISDSNLDKFAPIVYTGMGKINAAIKLHDAILLYNPDLVINYGSAGSVNNSNGFFHINTFIQRDMDARALGVARGVTPFSNQKLPKIKGIVLGTGDSFVTNSKKQLEGLNIRIDLVDMEGFALMEVCKHFEIEFQCYKFVTDFSDSTASTKWDKNISNGVEMFKKMLNKKYGISTLIAKKKAAGQTKYKTDLPFSFFHGSIVSAALLPYWNRPLHIHARQ